MKRLSTLFGALLVLATAAAACSSGEPAAEDDGSGASGTGTPAGEPGSQPYAHMNEAELSRMVTTLASDEMDGRDEGTAGSQLARTFIIEEMMRCGIQPAVGGSFEQPITTGAGVNVVGVIPGSDPALAERHVMISAHYDHLGHGNGEIYNGADDNAAGVAIILGVGCALAENPPAKSVVIASWDSEEPPTFLSPEMGSQYYVDNPVLPLELLDASLVLDLVGSDVWPGYEAHFVVGAELSPQVGAAIANAPLPEGLPAVRMGLHLAEEQPTGHQPWSDYNAFRIAGKPVVFFSNAQNKRYHTPADELATLNLPKMEREAQYLYEITKNLASSPETPVFVADGADYLTDATSARTVLEAAVAPGGMADSLGLTAQSRTALESDLADIAVIEQTLLNGGSIGVNEIRRLRDGAQRIMCLAGSTYAEGICTLF